MYREYEIRHEGTPHEGMTPHSGRFPFGSGDTPYQRALDFDAQRFRLKNSKANLSEIEIAQGLGFDTTKQLRQAITESKEIQKKFVMSQIDAVKKKYGNDVTAAFISREANIPDSTVRKYLKAGTGKKQTQREQTRLQLEEIMKHNKYLDVGKGENARLGVAQTMFDSVVKDMCNTGKYKVETIEVSQNFNPDKTTTMKVLTSDLNATRYDLHQKLGDIAIINHNIEKADGELTYGLKHPVQFIDSNRVKIRYAEDGGTDKDGIIEVRRSCKDLYLGKNTKYAQVRIGVDGDKYLKGVAVYGENMPKGVDVIFNTNKDKSVPKEKVLKEVERDKTTGEVSDNPFGTSIKRQLEYEENGKTKVSAINIVNEAGDWEVWSKSLSAQFLSKQDPKLAKQQLDASYAKQKVELDRIMQLTNPVIKQYLLEKHADKCDRAAVDLKAAALPGQTNNVILPFPKMKENEIYAPNYPNGTRVALIRYPHGAKFEIPVLTVNNNYPPAKKIIGASSDAVGINPRKGEQLSGADYDGDTAVVIPVRNPSGTRKVNIKAEKYPSELVEFDPKVAYRTYSGEELGLPSKDKSGEEIRYNIDGKPVKIMTKKGKGDIMGKITNLNADMQEGGADVEDVIKVVKHTMVVIDAYKHKLDYTQAAKDFEINELKKKYRPPGESGGAATIITRAGSQKTILDRSPINPVLDKSTGKPKNMTASEYEDWKNGKMIYRNTGKMKNGMVGRDEKGNPIWGKVPKTIKTTKMAYADDPYSLVGSTPTKMQLTYAKYASDMKNMANEARKEMRKITPPKANPQAKKAYAQEIASLNNKIKMAEMNRPLERKANALASEMYRALVEEHPEIREDNDWKKKTQQNCTNIARERVGKIKGTDNRTFKITITPKEWEAVQAGGITKTGMQSLLRYTNIDTIREYATPRTEISLSSAVVARIKSMYNNGDGYSQSAIADALGLSPSTISKALRG